MEWKVWMMPVWCVQLLVLIVNNVNKRINKSFE
jgi:hypothetical protein